MGEFFAGGVNAEEADAEDVDGGVEGFGDAEGEVAAGEIEGFDEGGGEVFTVFAGAGGDASGDVFGVDEDGFIGFGDAEGLGGGGLIGFGVGDPEEGFAGGFGPAVEIGVAVAVAESGAFESDGAEGEGEGRTLGEELVPEGAALGLAGDFGEIGGESELFGADGPGVAVEGGGFGGEDALGLDEAGDAEAEFAADGGVGPGEEQDVGVVGELGKEGGGGFEEGEGVAAGVEGADEAADLGAVGEVEGDPAGGGVVGAGGVEIEEGGGVVFEVVAPGVLGISEEEGARHVRRGLVCKKKAAPIMAAPFLLHLANRLVRLCA